MDEHAEFADLLGHLERTTRLDRTEAARVLDEVLAFFAELPRDFIVRRHASLQRAGGHSNDWIFERIRRELAARRFPAADLSVRQIRRLIYG
jgi:hypothetical protein